MTLLDHQISTSFRLSEFLRSESAQRHGIDNTPDAVALANIRNVLGPSMQRVRDLLETPVFVTSGYRSPQVNEVIRGSRNSQHLQGLAADFVSPQFGSPRAICRHLLQHPDLIRWDQLIWEGTWVHISFLGAGRPRGEVLTAHFTAGSVTYTHGIA